MYVYARGEKGQARVLARVDAEVYFGKILGLNFGTQNAHETHRYISWYFI